MTLGKLLASSVLVMVLVLASVSASVEISKSSFNYDTWIYKQDTHGRNKGFVLTHTWSSPSYDLKESSDYGLVSWRNININSQPPTNPYAALSQAFNSFNSYRSRTYSPYGYYSSGYSGYITNNWW